MNIKLAVSAAVLSLASVGAQAVSIKNSSFIDGWDSWNTVDPVSTSEDSADRDGNSVKIKGVGGYFSQTVTVEKDSNYLLSAYIEGAGIIGIDGVVNTSANTTSWEEVSVNFNSGNKTSVTIYGAYGGDEGRFDAFKLEPLVSCPSPVELGIYGAEDDGENNGEGPINAIDGDDTSLWSSTGVGKVLTLDLTYQNLLTELSLAWSNGDTREAYFDVETSETGEQWVTVLSGAQSSGETSNLESYGLDQSTARFVRIIAHGNSANDTNELLEVNAYGCSGDPLPKTPQEDYNLDPSKAPSENFDLKDWYVSVPLDDNGDSKADSIKGDSLDGYELEDYFYTAADGGMVFKVYNDGFKTSTSTSYTRTELREVLSRGENNTNSDMSNNWVFSSTPEDYQESAAGVNGVLRATLAVNHVTETGLASQYGRVIIGQIHAVDDEPIRLYYRKNPGNTNGTIYLAHEFDRAVGDIEIYDIFYGTSRSSGMKDPADGIPLGEKFSYEIRVSGNTLTATIFRLDGSSVSKTIDMTASGYNVEGQYMYFKAGVYNQNNTGDVDDYVQATFYEVTNKHEGYADE